MKHEIDWVSGCTSSAFSIPSHSHEMILDSRGISTGDTVIVYPTPFGFSQDKRDIVLSFYVNRFKKEFLYGSE
jgi:hypothetical protein